MRREKRKTRSFSSAAKRTPVLGHLLRRRVVVSRCGERTGASMGVGAWSEKFLTFY